MIDNSLFSCTAQNDAVGWCSTIDQIPNPTIQTKSGNYLVANKIM